MTDMYKLCYQTRYRGYKAIDCGVKVEIDS